LKENNVEKAHRILAHLLITEQEYFERLYGKDSKGFDFWPEFVARRMRRRWLATIADRYEKLLRRFEEEGLDLTARYRTSEGVWCENTFREMLTHVLFHSSIHRGNIMLEPARSRFRAAENRLHHLPARNEIYLVDLFLTQNLEIAA
jgi:uncharacterized damage-inducible protein DinB